MFSAFKRLASKGDGSQNNVSPGAGPKPTAMSTSLQKKFGRGVQYNMKIIIKGDRNVGKTCLFHRLQGHKFVEEYIPTDEIQVSSIQWNYKAADDIVKVEVWDVVDKGKKKKHFDGLKLENSQMEMPKEPALDAEFLDVYKGTNGVIMMLDLTKTWTFEYVQRELPKVPSHIPVIILSNHCDMSHHRTVTADHVNFYIESISGNRSAEVRHTESSMRNGFGLKVLHKFFNLPFLQLQKESLLTQLERNELETKATVQELDAFCESDEANYSKFLDGLVQKRREAADSNANIPPPNLKPPISGGNSPGGVDMKRSQSCSIVIGAGKPIPYGNPAQLAEQSKAHASLVSKSSSMSSGFVSKHLGGPTNDDVRLPDLKKLEVNPIVSVDEFCPDGGQLTNFLDDVHFNNNSQNNFKVVVDELSDSDTDTGNPLVSELQEDFEPEDQFYNSKQNKLSKYAFVNGPVRVDGSSENENEKTAPDEFDMKQTNDEFDSTINSEISELTSDNYDGWIAPDTKWRRSPEGGEDNSMVSQTLDYSNSDNKYDDTTSVTSSNVQMELLTSKKTPGGSSGTVSESEDTQTSNSVKKEKHRDKSEKKEKKHKKSKDKEKHKTREKSEKKHQKKSRSGTSSHTKDELEEFLNGSPSSPIDAAYEAI